MTLKEFSAEFLPLPESDDYHYNEWRQVFPNQLRFEEREVRKQGLFFSTTKRTLILQERWERVHKGEVINRKWRDVDVESIKDYDR